MGYSGLVNPKLFEILCSPDDGTTLSEDLVSRNGHSYHVNEDGVLMLDCKTPNPCDVVYQAPVFREWNRLLNERIQYYTKPGTIAGNLAMLSYRSIKTFNDRPRDEWVVDIGCGDGAQAELLNNKSTYIGIDRNLERLAIMKKKYPEANAIYCDASRLPFRDESIKFFFSSNAMEHIWCIKETIIELYRCCCSDARVVIVVPTEGGLWTLGRNIVSRAHFKKRYPSLDFDLISHIEHCNLAKQILRIFEIFFCCKVDYLPFMVPSIYCNFFIKFDCTPLDNILHSGWREDFHKLKDSLNVLQ